MGSNPIRATEFIRELAGFSSAYGWLGIVAAGALLALVIRALWSQSQIRR